MTATPTTTFLLTGEQADLQRAARSFARERVPVGHLRALRDDHDATGFARERWAEMAGLGWAGILVDEEHDGVGLGMAEVGLIVEELGRTLAPTPLLATAVLGASALGLGAGDALRRQVLPAVAAGQRLLALAHEEQRRFAPYHVTTTARRDGAGWRLDGSKVAVLDGHVADHLIVVARIAGAPTDRDGLGLFVVDAGAPGLAVTRTIRIDSRNAANVGLTGVVVGEDRALGRADGGAGADLLDRVLDRATAALCAEMLGGAQEAFDRTIAYLKERKQFGVPIGSFQALKHRAAYLFCELELTRSVVRAALVALDAGTPDAPALVSAAKARTSDTFLQVTAEAMQLHGGIGVTDDLDLGLFFKRARVAELTFGAASYHRDRFGRLHGY